MLPNLGDETRARLDQLFDQLIDAPQTERAAVLAKLQSEQPVLHDELVLLLEMAQRPRATLDPERVDRSAVWRALDDRPEFRPRPGERIGAWRLVRPLGQGGMGDVYEVARADGVYEQRAALKLILGTIDSRDFLERFARERQILAVLSHPGIARLLDGGEGPRGEPFLVMEFIDGVTIDQYCAARRLALRARLDLFLQVARAVEYAHRQHVIHRDIKPSNIMVTAGEVKLLDFGIAKVVSAGESEQGTTRTNLLLTPQYSTPEQVLGLPVDYRSDIYQLGLLLFELLTTQRAQEPIDSTPQALLRAVCVAARPAPSTCATGVSSAACGEVENLKPAALARQLRGDLDWIVLKALRQDPQRRYASVQALVDDVQRYLQGAPVHARAESWWYRAWKFVGLHPWGIASTAAAFLLAVAYGMTATLNNKVITTARDRATVEAQNADQVKKLVLRMLASAKPEETLGRELTVRELLDANWPSLQAEIKDQPQVQVEILDTLAETYQQLGSYDRARERLAEAQQLIAAHPQLPVAVKATTLHTLGRLLTDQGEYERAEQVLLEAQSLLTPRGSPQSPESAEVLKDLAQLEQERGRYTKAVVMYRQALATYEQLSGDNRLEAADGLSRLATVYIALGEYAEAAQVLTRTLDLQRQLLPAGHPYIASNVANLAEVRKRQGQLKEAEALFREALDSMQASRGAEHPSVATVRNNLARTLIELSRFDEAEALLQKSLAIRRATLGPRHELIAMALNDLGTLYHKRKDMVAAAHHFDEALEVLDADHPWRGIFLSNLGGTYQARGQPQRAEQLYRQSLELNRQNYGADHDLVGIDLGRLGNLLHSPHREKEAELALREALLIFKQRLGPTHPRTLEVSTQLERIAAESRTAR